MLLILLLRLPSLFPFTVYSYIYFLNEIYISYGCWLDFTVCYLNRYNNKMMPHYFDQLPVFDFCEWKIYFFPTSYSCVLRIFICWLNWALVICSYLPITFNKEINFYEKYLIYYALIRGVVDWMMEMWNFVGLWFFVDFLNQECKNFSIFNER